MTPEELERAKLAEALKAAWEDGFKAARHWPNHGLPVLQVSWDGITPRITPQWDKRKTGYLG